MSSSFISAIYTYPTPTDFKRETEPVSIEAVKNWFDAWFLVSPNSKSTVLTIRDNLLKELNTIFGKSIELKDDEMYDHLNFARFITQYPNDCIEAVNAYKFYGNRIVDQINKLTDYIKQANDILNAWSNLNTTDLSDQEISDLIHKDVVDLECLMSFSLEIEKNFSTRFIYDFDEDTWKSVDDDYSADALNSTDTSNSTNASTKSFNSQIGTATDYTVSENNGYHKSLNKLRTTSVRYDRKGNKVDDPPKPLECFNELNLLDRLKYIKIYYDITGGETEYVFPNNASYGLPCIREEDKTKYIANIEKFYLGYLIDRDGPVNAFAGFFEMKVKAIEASIGIKQQELRAYNAYLNFLNRGFDMLNSSQSDGAHRICDGAIIAMTYLCCQKMYKLFTDDSGKEFLVIPSVEHPDKFFLVPNDEYGMQFLIGDNGTVGSHRGNSSTNLVGDGELELKNGHFKAYYTSGNSSSMSYYNGITVTGTPTTYYKSNGKTINYKNGKAVFYETEIKDIKGTFSLPDELSEVNINVIDPKSVYKYASAYTYYTDTKEATNKHTSWEAVIESWTSTFQTKLTYIDTALKTTQNDIQTLRDTINTFESLTKTLRSRTHDAGLNVANKLVL